ncbi:class III extradiol ring-cleavage dioxygenase [Nitrosovibrio sp. Nv17]|uniref:DODA-type extradiol aromatic ring-opening family dioxygenase n=1 Tax=Nitrosovibrio sp. Nv17 TaxID=1855339 RepID=UPI000908F5CA|nr:class III extradiol ring-cleavage dioxygenase [Nitrosovibrio sp. Nv17]SFW20975.1 4,5-DOPA dioxygenase extradiol [Nitrosovibrio sp. Nv17]
MPALFLSHGSPMLALEDEPTTAFLRSLPERLPRPDAIVVASAHWETGEAVVGGAAHPETLHDFHGFPEALYALRYPAPGQPRLAARMRDLLVRAGFATTVDPVRGLDHGAWNPLLLMYPEADIPVVQLSVQPCRDADWHYRLGRALAPLGRDNILLIGSGNLTHNLREAFDGRHAHAPDWVVGFAEWVAGKTEARDIDALLEWQARAPDARRNHPTTEHFVPFLVALGAAGAYRRVERLNREFQMGVLAMDAYVFSE